MKIALYIEDGLEQIVLTPETENEKNLLDNFHSGRTMEIKKGSFYECKGGYMRYGIYKEHNAYAAISENDKSTMFVFRNLPVEKPSDEEFYGTV